MPDSLTFRDADGTYGVPATDGHYFTMGPCSAERPEGGACDNDERRVTKLTFLVGTIWVARCTDGNCGAEYCPEEE